MLPQRLPEMALSLTRSTVAVVLAFSMLPACAPVVKQELGVADFSPSGGQAARVQPPALTVFFDLDSNAITADAAATLDRLAKAYRHNSYGRVLVTGHADRSGSELRNLDLSGRRAAAVHDYLMGRGVPVEIVSTEARGETQGMVATRDGVAEPQNRRVEIFVDRRR